MSHVVIEKEWERFVNLKNDLVSNEIPPDAASNIIANVAFEKLQPRNVFVSVASNFYKYLEGNGFREVDAVKIVVDYMNSRSF